MDLHHIVRIPESRPCYCCQPLFPSRQRQREKMKVREEGEQRGELREKAALTSSLSTKAVQGPNSHSQCSLKRGTGSFRVTLGQKSCSGWKYWELWNASENQSPLRQYPSSGHHSLGPCLLKTISSLMENKCVGLCSVVPSREGYKGQKRIPR